MERLRPPIVTVESIPIVVDREDDGYRWADIESMPGMMAYGQTREAAIANVNALALPVAADCIDHGEDLSRFSALKLRDAVLHRLDAIIQGTHHRVTLPVTKVRSSRPLKKLSQQPRLHDFRVLTQFAFRLVQ